MLNLAKELLALLSPKQRSKLFQLQFLVFFMSLAEVFGILSVGPFIALADNPSLLLSKNTLSKLYLWSGLESPESFIFYMGIAVITALALGTVLSVVTTWRLNSFGARIGYEMGNELYRYYLYKPWQFHSSGNSAQLTKAIASETYRVTYSVILPMIHMIANIIMSSLMLLALVIFKPGIALASAGFFGGTYFFLFKTVRKRISNNGKLNSKLDTVRYKLMNEGFGGVKDLLLLGRQKGFIQEFENVSMKLASAQAVNRSLSIIPRYLLELLAYGSIILIILVSFSHNNSSLAEILPVLAVYALSGMKILPAFQHIYGAVTLIKAGQAAFNSIKKDLFESKRASISQIEIHEKLPFKEQIELNQIQFSYAGSSRLVLNCLSLKIPHNKTVGFVGPSGSGKSTIIDLLLALIPPQGGSFLVDGVRIQESNKRQWQNCIGFVPQSIFLSDATIMENIAFGLSLSEIDEARVKQALRLSHLETFVATLNEGIYTRVGERGVQLSGGQRQRIGIARALYSNADILVFDEATSSLDGITEKLIMEAISDFSGNKTIVIVAHRLTTVKNCDVIYFIDQGRVLDSGTYNELISRNKVFQEMTLN